MSSAFSDDASLTQWLNQFDGPDPAVGQRLFEALYDELRRLARSHMRREDPGHTLSATALTHEAWFRMAEQSRTQWRNRGHFMAVASTMMRRILVNHEQARRAGKRDAELAHLSFGGLDALALAPDRDVLAVHESLLAFEQVDPRAAKIVELRFFGGLEIEEIAEALGISAATVKRDWTLAKAWLHRDLAAPSAPPSTPHPRRAPMRHEVSVSFDGQDWLDTPVAAEDVLPSEEARHWLDAEFVRLDCSPLRASGKVLTADKVLAIADAAGRLGFEDAVWRRAFARATCSALARPQVRIDLAALSLTY